jgi:predicted peptidase
MTASLLLLSTMKKIPLHRSLIYVPEGAGPHPVLCFLHGAGEAALSKKGGRQSLDKLLEHQSPAWHSENRSSFIGRFLIICPQLESYRRWEGEEARSVDELVNFATNLYNGDPSRLALTGFSYGGDGTFQIACRSRLRWSAIWAVDPALQRTTPRPNSDVRVWVHHGSEQPGKEYMPKFITDLGLQLWPQNPRRVLTALKTNHVTTCVEAFGQAIVYEWLLP